jgi:imidazolonepropionase-like amidohydrolase
MGRRVRRVMKWSAVALLSGVLLVLVAFALGVLWPEPELPASLSLRPLAIVDVSIVDVENGRIVPGQTVVSHRGHITAAGSRDSVLVPGDAERIDGRGRFLMPALWDMHTHVYAFAPLLDMPLYIASGVTNVRDMQGCPEEGDPFIACHADKRRWTHEAVTGQRIGPRIVQSTSFMANGPRMVERLGDVPRYFGTATPDEAREFVRHFAGKADAIKVYDGIPREAYFALTEEARRLGLPVVGHRPHAVSASEAARHQRSLEHARFLLHESFDGAEALRRAAGTAAWREDRRAMVDRHDPRMVQEIFAAMREAGTYYVPTHLTRWSDAYADQPAVREDPQLRFLHPLLQWQWVEDLDALIARDPSPEARRAYVDFYRKGLELTGAAQQAGVKLMVGTDYITAGLDVHRELEQLVLAGLTPAQALRAATVTPAEYMGQQELYGRIAPGRVADMVLLDGDPLRDIHSTRQLRAVIFNGNLYDHAALERMTRHVERQARSWTVACKVLWRFVQNPASY